MASRTTLQEAQELKAKWQAEYPSAEFRIIDNSKAMKIGRGAAEMRGYKIIEDTGRIIVLAEVTQFDVLEIRECYKCGAEILTAAIGEGSLNECRECKAGRQIELAAEQRKAEQKIKSGEYTNADLDSMVRTGLAKRIYGDPDSNRPTGIVIK